MTILGPVTALCANNTERLLKIQFLSSFVFNLLDSETLILLGRGYFAVVLTETLVPFGFKI